LVNTVYGFGLQKLDDLQSGQFYVGLLQRTNYLNLCLKSTKYLFFIKTLYTKDWSHYQHLIFSSNSNTCTQHITFTQELIIPHFAKIIKHLLPLTDLYLHIHDCLVTRRSCLDIWFCRQAPGKLFQVIVSLWKYNLVVLIPQLKIVRILQFIYVLLIFHILVYSID
jgi:hypothetical protein